MRLFKSFEELLYEIIVMLCVTRSSLADRAVPGALVLVRSARQHGTIFTRTR